MKETEIQKLENTILNVFYEAIMNSEYSDWEKGYSYKLYKNNLLVNFRDNDEKFSIDFEILQDENEKNTINPKSVYTYNINLSKNRFRRFFYNKIQKKIYLKLESIVETNKQEKKYKVLKNAIDHIPVAIIRKEKLKDIENNDV